MRELDVVGVRVEQPSNQPLVLLRELEGTRSLPIWIGPVEASAIASAHEGLITRRPQTHDLLLTVLEALNESLEAVHIVDVSEGVFTAELILDSGMRIDARPSDAIVLALKSQVRIYCTEDVLDVAGLIATADEDDEVLKFREFLDEIEPEDFEP